MKNKMFCFLLCLLFIFNGCLKLKHDITIQPVHVIVEITVKVDRALNDFFGDIDKAATEQKDERAEEVKQ
ncbi:MAG TPA: hypothetical protein VK186_24875 [Candidatus Deferrimicrobium sp.]|nr:hypothetical protein [Candidatus Deferrimicrobium sp.]